MRLTIDFDEYETALLRKVRQELKAVANRNGKKPPGIKDVARGAVRMGVHAVYGDNFVAGSIMSATQHLNLVEGSFDSSQNEEDDRDEDGDDEEDEDA